MEKKDIFLTIFVIIALAFSIYRRYLKNKQGNSQGKESNTSFGSGSRDDDYEPYRK